MTMSEDKRNSTSGSTSLGSVRTRVDVVLPQSKVKVIMKSSPEIENIGHDALYLITKATELFIDHMASTSLTPGKGKTLQYKNLAEIVQKNENLEFLKDIIPVKIPARVALQEMAKQTTMLNKELLE